MQNYIRERFEKAISKMYEEENYLAVQICRLGIPQESNEIQTASVQWDDNSKKIKFLFNKKFAEILNDDEFKFVLAHESIHLLNGHIELLNKKISELPKQKIPKFIKKFNIAADCVVNDSLVNIYGFKKVLDKEDKIKPKIHYGKEKIKQDCHDLTVMDVYYLLKDEEDQKENTDADTHNWSDFFDEKGNIKKEFQQTINNFIKEIEENPSLSEKENEILEKAKEEKRKEKLLSNNAGNTTKGIYRPINYSGNIRLKWNKFFSDLIEIKKQKTIWSKVNNKLITCYPDILLPNYTNEEKDTIFIAVDSSGSIDPQALNLFSEIVKTISTKFIIKSISFDTKCYDYDIKKDTKIKGGGGTNFQIIENWINQNLKKYPKAIYVLTDGCGTSVFPKYKDRWCFILYGMCSTEFCKDMKYLYLKDLIL